MMFGMDHVARDMLPSLLWRMKKGRFELQFDESGFKVVNCGLTRPEFQDFARGVVGDFGELKHFEELLRELFCLVRAPTFDDKQREDAIEAYASIMVGRYTPFVASAVFDDWADNCARWPEWSEIKLKLDQGMEQAGAIVRAVQQLLDTEGE